MLTEDKSPVGDSAADATFFKICTVEIVGNRLQWQQFMDSRGGNRYVTHTRRDRHASACAARGRGHSQI